MPACVDPLTATGRLPSDDTYIDAAKPSNVYGTVNRILVQADAGATQRGLLQFDLSDIPAGAVITGADLYLYGTNLSTSNVIFIYRVTSPWDETTATWQTWSAPGGDFDASVAYVSFIPSQTNCSAILDMLELVQQWVNGSQPNHGVLLYGTGANRQFTFASKEDAANMERAPRLNVTYTTGTQTGAPDKNIFALLLNWLRSL